MAYVLPWRRKKQNQILIGDEMNMYQLDSLITFLRENPGIRWNFAIKPEYKPINYMEIGVFKGENIRDISRSYCKHPDSKIYCVDPWIDYDEYPEYKGKIETIYQQFKKNMETENLSEKIEVHRGFSHNVVPNFEDNFFDISFIDGNHETEFVYKDGIVVLPKMKSGGTIIFDDYNWPTVKTGVQKFLEENSSQLKNLRYNEFQLFVDKL